MPLLFLSILDFLSFWNAAAAYIVQPPPPKLQPPPPPLESWRPLALRPFFFAIYCADESADGSKSIW